MTLSNGPVPDGVSFSDLQSLMTDRRAQRAETNDVTPEQITDKDQLTEIAKRHLGEAYDECKNPLVHKAMIVYALCMLFEWHNKLADETPNLTRDEEVGILRDAGKLQSCLGTLVSIHMADDDWLVQ